ncbi:type VI secretion system membrane subunit TssM [Roseomonas sp. JC162]|uniref:Type VI secretion system membrane subunit TssM n=1 Tax=Neoroseomonas marina TaxID=1232220 RepID=A0A848E718_9PROT|nr:type VI secretion system membrane subunit TssM [Neoroseomonas marina]NMJ39952.1 type VI secretion system membrane subunit TssM [Neoroseomonas marina]
MILQVFAPFLSGRALAALAGVSLLLPVIWLFGPLLTVNGVSPLASEINRMILCAVLFVIVLGFIWIMDRRKRRRDALLVQGIAEPDPGADRAAEEEAELRDKLTAALDKLKATSGKKGGFLYEQPWYVIIGPPGSGKTTALANSGLEFPLTDGGKLQGVGGTRLCEWWLTDNAVLIDTAGRYTSQDSDAAADKAGWERFLNLLKKSRPRLPLNGVMVTFGVDMISRLGPAEREQHARAVRRRIKELEEKLGQRLPVYFMISKADLLAGFMEFYDDLDKTAREQVWGFTFPVQTASEIGPVSKFAEEFQALLSRLQDRMLERLQQERGPQQRAALAGFPAQFASLEAPLTAFVTAAFGGTRLDPAPMLRGVYFTSGTQEGSPLDRLAGALSRSFGLDPRRPAAVMQQKGRAYFITRLLKDVIFNEARLASGDRKADKRRRVVAIAAWSIAGLVTLGGGLYGWKSWSDEQARERRLSEQVAKAEQASQGIPFERISEAEFRRVLPYLDAARDLPPAARGDGGGLGLSQEGKLVAGANAAYRRALDRSFLPRLLARLEQEMRAAFQRPDELYDATRAYLMLGQEGPLDADLVKSWFARDWLRTFPGQVNQPVRDSLMAHLDATIGRNFLRYPVDGALVDASRRIFSRLPLADRVASRLQTAAAAANVQPWRPSDALGQAGQRYFTRASGAPLTDGVPALYTLDGLYRGLLPVLGQAVRQGVAEYWVLGPEGANLGTDDPVRLEQEVLRLYAEEYVRQWQRMLDDINLLPLPPALPAQAEALNILGAPNSPVKDLLRSISRQLTLGTPPQGWAPPGRQPRPAPQPGQPPQQQEPTGAEPVAAIVEQRFEALRTASGDPIDGVLRIVNDLFVQVQRLATAPPGTVPAQPAGLDPGQRLQAEAARQPQPIQRWLNAMVTQTNVARGGGAKAAIAAAAAQQLAPACRGLDQRFPFNINGEDLPVDDFNRLFGRGGVFDQFFTQNVRQYVDTTQNPWRPMATDGLPPPISAADLMQFQRAAQIRDAFYPSAASLGLRFDLVPRSMDPGATQAILEFEGTRTEIAQGGSARPIAMSWPARGNTTLTFDPPSTVGPLAYDGPWSAMRLVMRRNSTLAAGPSPERLRLRVQQGERTIDFELRAGSSQHPFGLAALQQFRCPTFSP